MSVPPLSRVALENQLPGNPAQCSGTTVTPEHCWDTDHLDDEEIRGFATQMSVQPGDRVFFKITTGINDPPFGYRVGVYRMGDYHGAGVRLQDIAELIQPALVRQPDCTFDGRSDGNTGLVDCGSGRPRGGGAGGGGSAPPDQAGAAVLPLSDPGVSAAGATPPPPDAAPPATSAAGGNVPAVPDPPASATAPDAGLTPDPLAGLPAAGSPLSG